MLAYKVFFRFRHLPEGLEQLRYSILPITHSPSRI